MQGLALGTDATLLSSTDRNRGRKSHSQRKPAHQQGDSVPAERQRQQAGAVGQNAEGLQFRTAYAAAPTAAVLPAVNQQALVAFLHQRSLLLELQINALAAAADEGSVASTAQTPTVLIVSPHCLWPTSMVAALCILSHGPSRHQRFTAGIGVSCRSII